MSDPNPDDDAEREQEARLLDTSEFAEPDEREERDKDLELEPVEDGIDDVDAALIDESPPRGVDPDEKDPRNEPDERGPGTASEEINGARQVSTMEDKLDSFVFPVVNVMTRGVCGSIQGAPLEVILAAISRCLGRVVGLALSQGPLGPVLSARGACKNAFESGVSSIVPQPPADPAAKPTLQRPRAMSKDAIDAALRKAGLNPSS